jgi:DNA-directed RNA polymerase subunit M/transcription elongation factor TFIIS
MGAEQMGNTIGRRREGGGAEMWRFKGCPKCGGDLFVDYDLNGWYEECLQCGYLRDLKTIFEVKAQKAEKSEQKSELVLAGHHRKAMRNN